MKILQIGYPKSGNYWLYRIIQEVLHIAGVDQKNYIQGHPIYSIAQKWELSYPQQVNINMMDILYAGSFFRISSIFRKRIEDLEKYINSNTHIWSHSNYCTRSKKVFSLLDKIIYIIRDPRDIALSKADFAFTPYMKKHYPTWHESPAQYIGYEAENIGMEWEAHVTGYLRHAARHNILILFYERLKNDFDHALKILLDYLGFSFTAEQRKYIAQKVSSENMREQSPQHVRKAAYYKWKKNMSEQDFQRITSAAGGVLVELNYPQEQDEDTLPQAEGSKFHE